MHPALVAAYWKMLPRLRAEEELRLVNAIAAGSNHLKPHALRDYLRGLEASLGLSDRRPITEARAQAIGIRVHRVPARKETPVG